MRSAIRPFGLWPAEADRLLQLRNRTSRPRKNPRNKLFRLSCVMGVGVEVTSIQSARLRYRGPWMCTNRPVLGVSTCIPLPLLAGDCNSAVRLASVYWPRAAEPARNRGVCRTLLPPLILLRPSASLFSPSSLLTPEGPADKITATYRSWLHALPISGGS